MGRITSRRTHLAAPLAEAPLPLDVELPQQVDLERGPQSWLAFRTRFARVATGDAKAKWPDVARTFERHCQPTSVADISEETFTRFVDGLTAEGFATDQVRAKLTTFRAGVGL